MTEKELRSKIQESVRKLGKLADRKSIAISKMSSEVHHLQALMNEYATNWWNIEWRKGKE